MTLKKIRSKEEWGKWIADEKNRSIFLQQMNSQMLDGGLDSSKEIPLMMKNLESAMREWGAVFGGEKKEFAVELITTNEEYLVCSESIHSNDDDKKERIQELREEENAHKTAAFDLILQATGEALGAGVSIAGGMEYPALVGGIQATRHFLEGCKEYNLGGNCAEQASLLEGEDEEDESKKWWQFWK